MKPEKKKTAVRILALAAVVLIAALVLATFICAVTGAPANVIAALLFCDVVIPLFLWVFLWVTRKLRSKNPDQQES